ncbi:uncharacterized protein LOC132545086 [Ylistrum balloti]|uniref:uncharacterized protein LOC132545086 n=1 Tax=Ylistrum balloti TaxID=509963 RepID=UPI00290596C5|nr:uncharacterized protein LOC132545086 [Ylistrum balloti]
MALMILKLQEINHLPISTVDSIVQEIDSLYEQAFDQTEAKVINVLRQQGITGDIVSSVKDVFGKNHLKKCTELLKTNARRNSYWESSLTVVKPISVMLGRNSRHVKRVYQYIPILDSIRSMLSQEDALVEVMNSHKSNGQELVDFCDGKYFRENPLFSKHENALQVILYFDEFEVVNPLGSRKGIHKIAAFYFTLGNFSPEKRSELNPIQLCVLCTNKDLREFGFESVLQALINDLKQLETVGTAIPGLESNLLGSLAYISADNLGSHQIGGFVECFNYSVKNMCRFCLANTEDTQTDYDSTHFESRNVENYNHHVHQMDVNSGSKCTSVCGVKRDSPFNSLQYFHVTRGLPPDCMHDILEGCARYEVPLVLQSLEKDCIVKSTDILSSLQTWKYGMHDSTTKPTTPTCISSFTQSASQMWTLLRLMPLIIGKFIPEESKVWEVLLLLKDITKLTFSPKMSPAMCAYLKALIIDHHKLFKEVFPNENLRSKHHFLIHYPEMIMNFGPVRTCWCMRFEAKHSYFKQLALRVRNFKNINATLAQRHQNLQACITSSGNDIFKTHSEVLKSSNVALASLDPNVGQALMNKGVSKNEQYLSKLDRVNYKGHAYKPGCFVVHHYESDDIVLSKIIAMFSHNYQTLLVVQICDSVYEPHFRAYKILKVVKVEAVRFDEILDVCPLDPYRLNQFVYVVLKHSVLFR